MYRPQAGSWTEFFDQNQNSMRNTVHAMNVLLSFLIKSQTTSIQNTLVITQ
jgi:hypothetical protein